MSFASSLILPTSSFDWRSTSLRPPPIEYESASIDPDRRTLRAAPCQSLSAPTRWRAAATISPPRESPPDQVSERTSRETESLHQSDKAAEATARLRAPVY